MKFEELEQHYLDKVDECIMHHKKEETTQTHYDSYDGLDMAIYNVPITSCTECNEIYTDVVVSKRLQAIKFVMYENNLSEWDYADVYSEEDIEELIDLS